MAVLKSTPEEARQFARVIASDVVTYATHHQRIEAGIRDGNLDQLLAEKIDESRALFEARVEKELFESTNFLERAMTDVLVRHAGNRPVWRLALARIRARLLPGPACPVCRRVLDLSRLVDGYLVDRNADPAPLWRFFFGCPQCLSVTRLDWTEGWASAAPAGVEVTGAVIARMRERLADAHAAGRLVEEVAALRADPQRGWLLGIPELFALARRGLPGTLTLRHHAVVVDPDPQASVFYPSPFCELARYSDLPEVLELRKPAYVLVQQDPPTEVLYIGSALTVAGVRGGRWVVVGSPGLPTHFRAIDGFLVEGGMVSPGEEFAL